MKIIPKNIQISKNNEKLTGNEKSENIEALRVQNMKSSKSLKNGEFHFSSRKYA